MSDRHQQPPAEPVTETAPPLTSRVLMSQDWRDLAYLHWAIDPAQVADRMPPGVRPDVHDGRTYVGLVPFTMVGAGLGHGPGVPWLGTFLETNVRLYSVDRTGRRGVVFLSLDSDRLVVVAAARFAFGTPYRWARMRHLVDRAPGPSPVGDVHTWTATLRDRTARARGATSLVRLRVGEPREATPLDRFLSARWGLHTEVFGRTRYIPNEHPAWPLHAAEVLDLDDQLVTSAGFGDLAARPPDHVAFSPGVHTRFGLPVDARRPRPSG
ncbi:YqjF family protein [Nocardioides sp. GCM10027113]|uniref:YqjF family protein n=1 Tax=unclassified Nocardioides TaxID=2615069 RepID=UPI003617EF3B